MVPVANRHFLEFAILTAGSLLEWRLFHILHGSRNDYFSFFSPLYGRFVKKGTLLLDVPRFNGRLVSDLLLVAIPVMLWILLILRTARGDPAPELAVRAR